MSNNVEVISKIKPSERQLLWQRMEFYAFIHFTMNTYTGREWGLGNEDRAIFNPVEFDADQWVEVCKSAGMKGLILTCKHHDGFCLWPSKYTEYSVKNSPWRQGNSDMVKEVAKACKKGGIKFGVYLSPWDRHEQTYGSEEYNKYFTNQLEELLTNYGDVFCVWFDGACGEGPNGNKQVYDWDAYYKVIRELQPNAVISVCGPDVRWCGNEAGHCRDSEWSVVPAYLQDTEKIQESSQKEDDGLFARLINTRDSDLGSREVIKNEENLIWYPAEVNTSIRPGWFYHEEENDKVRSIDELLNIYYGSVGGNGTFLLNLPPDKRGLIHENDVARMKEFGDVLRAMFQDNLTKNAVATANETMDEFHSVQNIFDEKIDSYWCPKEGTEHCEIEIDLQDSMEFDRVVLKEHIENGQRVEKYTLEYRDNNEWKVFYSGTIIGYKHICCFDQVRARYIRFTIERSRWCPEITNMSIFLSGLKNITKC